MKAVSRLRTLVGYQKTGNPPIVAEYILIQIPRKSRPKTSIIVPAYNEEEGVGVVLESIFKAVDGVCEVIVVDDGSHDKTSEVASRYPCCLIRHGVNRGKAEAIKTGIRHSQGENIIFIDADGTYPAEAIPQMSEALESGDVVYGSRATGRDNMPYINRFGNSMFRNIIKHIYGFKANDYSTGLYGIKKRYLDSMGINSCGFNIEMEIAIKASRMNLVVRDIPIEYQPRLGKTKLCSWKVGLGHMKTILSHLAWRGPQRNNHDIENDVTSLEA